MRAIKVSENIFENTEEINFEKNKLVYFLINLSSIAAFVIFYVLFYYILELFSVTKSANIYVFVKSLRNIPDRMLIVLLIILIITMVIHEIIHGIFFYLFTRQLPVFGIKKLSAYAGAPGWYLKKGYYLIICLSPLFTLTIFGFGSMMLTQNEYFLIAFIVTSVHAAGCVGDLWVSFVLLKKPAETYVNDNGMVIRIGYGNRKLYH